MKWPERLYMHWVRRLGTLAVKGAKSKWDDNWVTRTFVEETTTGKDRI